MYHRKHCIGKSIWSYDLAVQGRSNKEIGSFFGISYRTVEIHKSKIMQKTGATNLLDLARIARESDLGE